MTVGQSCLLPAVPLPPRNVLVTAPRAAGSSRKLNNLEEGDQLGLFQAKEVRWLPREPKMHFQIPQHETIRQLQQTQQATCRWSHTSIAPCSI